MGRFGTAIRLFFRVLGDQYVARQARELLDGSATPRADAIALPPERPEKPVRPPGRSDALNLLAVLQRESRLLDFLKESIDAYSNEQIGAAVRDVHRDASAAIERLFALRPVMQEPEGSTIQVAAGADAGRLRLLGNVTGQPPYSGTLRHPGWEATKTQLPEWSGVDSSARVVAPAEVEL